LPLNVTFAYSFNLLSIAKIPSLCIFIHLQTFSVNS
jgi:hypothetical protein